MVLPATWVTCSTCASAGNGGGETAALASDLASSAAKAAALTPSVRAAAMRTEGIRERRVILRRSIHGHDVVTQRALAARAAVEHVTAGIDVHLHPVRIAHG